MHVSIRLPKELRGFVGDRESVDVDAQTVGQALAVMTQQHPELRDRVFDAQGRLYSYLAVVHEGQSVDLRSDRDRPVAAGDTIELLGIASGG